MKVKINCELNDFTLFLLLSLFLILTYFLIKTEFQKGDKRIFLLEIFSTILILFLLLQIDFNFKIKKREKSNFIVMIDNSLSMSFGKNGKKRIDEVKEIIRENKNFKLFNPVFYTFNSTLKKIKPEEIENITADGEETVIFKNLLKVNEIFKNEKISGIFLFTDGIESYSENLNFENLKIPIYAFEVGDKNLKDISIVKVIKPAYIYKGEKGKIIVYLKSSGLKGERLEVSLKKGGKLIDKEILKPEEENVKVEFEITGEKEGYENYQINIESSNEITYKNNFWNFNVMVVKPKIEILYVEGYLRWEYKYLKSFLEENQLFEPVCLINIGKQIFQQTGGKSFNFEGNLFENYKDIKRFHIIILGDIDFSTFDSSQKRNIEYFVKNGGNLILLGGKNFLKGTKLTEIENILPVKLEGNENYIIEGEFKPLFTPFGKNLSVFQDIGELPFLYSINNVKKSNEDAIVILTGKDNLILMAYKNYGKGVCLILATDSLWRWYIENKGKFESFLNRIIRFLLPVEKYLGIKENVPDFNIYKNFYKSGEKVEIEAIFGNKEMKENTKFILIEPDGMKKNISLEGNKIKFIPEKEGVYLIETNSRQFRNYIEIYVMKEGIESFNLIPDYDYLKILSQETKGKFISKKENQSVEKFVTPLYKIIDFNIKFSKSNSKWIIPLIFILLNFSWYLRRVSGRI